MWWKLLLLHDAQSGILVPALVLSVIVSRRSLSDCRCLAVSAFEGLWGGFWGAFQGSGGLLGDAARRTEDNSTQPDKICITYKSNIVYT